MRNTSALPGKPSWRNKLDDSGGDLARGIGTVLDIGATQLPASPHGIQDDDFLAIHLDWEAISTDFTAAFRNGVRLSNRE